MNFWQNGGGDVSDRINAYSGKSEAELMSELKTLAAAMKANGNFDIGQLESAYAAAQCFLNAAQLERMRALIDMLRD